MKTASAKNKGRRGQKAIVDAILKAFPVLTENDVHSVPMGVMGVDIWLSEAAKGVFPFSVESKVQEKLNIWAALEQAESNIQPGTYPLLVFSRNRSGVYATLRFEDFMEIISRLYRLSGSQDAD